jgi:hypothetical protein
MDQQQLFVKMGLASWNLQIARAEKTFNAFSDEELEQEVAPGKNRIIYLYGHLATYHDMLKETLGIGTTTKPELIAYFLKNADDHGTPPLSVPELKAYWTSVHTELTVLFTALPPADWFKRHNAMTDEDFEKDPTRNKLSVLLNRANHVAYHIGQINLVKHK